jgi:replicative DNA helicase
MSDEAKKFDDSILHESIAKKAILENKREEVQEKELLVRERRANNALEVIKANDLAVQIALNTDYGQMAAETIEKIQKENMDYIMAAKKRISFICKPFDETIPFFRKNLILIAARTGEGKSTAVANIVIEMLKGVNRENGKPRRVLVITNEEVPSDVYNRIACLMKGWDYVNHSKFTEQQLETFSRCIEFLARDKVTVIDQNYNGSSGLTTSLEGICQIFDNLIRTKTWYDAIIIDYYQRITESKKNPQMTVNDVQYILGQKLDTYKNIYPAPIVIMAQVKPQDKQETPFEVRIKGRKSIIENSTCAVEMIPNRDNRTTEWLVHKNRFSGMSVGQKVTTGYDKGRFVEWNDEFRDMVAKMRAAIENDTLNKQIGHMPTGEENEDVS